MTQITTWRESLGLPSTFQLGRVWSDHMVAAGMKRTSRICHLLDMVAVQKLTSYGCGLLNLHSMSLDEKISLLKDTFCDVSQNPKFASFTNIEGTTGCLATSTTLYSFGKDRAVLPFELALFQGHRRGIRFPEKMKPNQIRDLCGEGMNLCSLGSVIWAMYLLKGLP